MSQKYLAYKLHVKVFSSDYWLHVGLLLEEEVLMLYHHILCRQLHVKGCVCLH